jgi:RimJ/RimL family protein N-acetyltransferase
MDVRIVLLDESHIDSLRETVDHIARERIFLPFTEAPSLESMRKFLFSVIERRRPYFVAASEDRVVGWCEVEPHIGRASFAHRGELGVGLLPNFRGRGVGRRLIQRTIDAAFEFGLSRIELTVRERNSNAIALYRSLGFLDEGLLRNALYLDDHYENLCLMALLKSGERGATSIV